MPSVSAKQHNLMEAVAHNPGFAKKVGIPQKVGKHFHEADKVKKKFAMGGPTGMAPPRPIAPMTGMSGMRGMGGSEPRQGPMVSPIGPMSTQNLSAAPRYSGFKKGGHVKHANELEGKAKETKHIADEEMKALKRGHAPKEIMEHEKAEHKAMGYKKGGGVETARKGFAMAETKGGRKPPHGKHTSEGDSKLKGFGMAKGTGHGRTVKKSSAGSQETNRKGFAMKKGGNVKHHEKHMKRGGVSARMKPGALAAMMKPQGMDGPMPQMGGAMPGMAHGGHVGHHAHHGQGHQIHHHHHYAKGGHVKHEPMAGPHMVRKVHAASSHANRKEDGVAHRGHTKGKQVKMAHGGHVGSHSHRDGIAARGHTRAKRG